MKIKTKSKKVNKQWLHDHVNDPYVKLAQREGYRARAAYKLKEIDEQLKLLRPGQLVVDLGSTPGAWSQYLRAASSPRGGAGGRASSTARIVALDMLEMEPIEGVALHPGRFPRGRGAGRARTRRVDGATGRRGRVRHGAQPVGHRRGRHRPHGAPGRAGARLRAAAPEAGRRPGAKVFHGSGYSELVELFKANFRVVKAVKPKASRDKSSETFLVGFGLKNPAAR